jgi:hypothetical protein
MNQLKILWVILLSILFIPLVLADTGGDTVYTMDVNGTNYTVRIFNQSGTYTATFAHNVEVLIVAGGGAGAQGVLDDNGAGGGGGGGGVYYNASIPVTTPVSIIVGLGARNHSFQSSLGKGNASSFGIYNTTGGGYGGSVLAGQGIGEKGGNGGSGGGGGGQNNGVNASNPLPNRGSGNGTQGTSGGDGSHANPLAGGGGGGCATNGTAASGGTAGAGGNGCLYNLTGTPTYYGSGGGGSGWSSSAAANSTPGGGAGSGTGIGGNGVNGTGGGGGAGDAAGGGAGGNGIVIIRYPTSQEGGDTQALTINTIDYFTSNPITGFCLNATGTNTSQYLCNVTGTSVKFNTTGIYNLSVFNITAGNTTPVYLNATFYNYNFTTSQTVQLPTSQSQINLSVYKLFLNTSINNFNATNKNLTNQTTTGTLLIPANNGTNNLQINVAGNYTKNITCTGISLQLVTCNATGVYDSIITINATNITTPVQNFILNITNTTLDLNNLQNTTVGPGFIYEVLQGYSYLINFRKLGLNDDNVTINVANNSYSYTFLVAPSPAINVSIYDELTNTLITGENFTLEIINDLYSANYTITNGLRFINLTSIAGYTTLRYYSDSYAQRDYIIELNPGSFYQLRLYDINLTLSQVVTATVYDTGNRLIENATISLLRYFVDCNCYRTVQMTSTGGDGSGIFYVQALDGHYKWSVAYLGTVYYLSTSPEQINTDTRTFVIDLGQNFYTGFESITTLGYAVTYNTTSQTLSYIYTDTGTLVTGGCLRVTRLVSVEYQTFDEECTTGSSGSVFITLTNTNTTNYYYTAIINTSNLYTPIVTVDTGSVEHPPLYNFGDTGIFFAVGILAVLVTIFSFSAVATVLISAVGVIIISFLGIMTFTASFIVGICCLILGISIFLMRS